METLFCLRYISVENNQQRKLDVLKELGYTRFKLVLQGAFRNEVGTFSSGAFGEQAVGTFENKLSLKWRTYDQILNQKCPDVWCDVRNTFQNVAIDFQATHAGRSNSILGNGVRDRKWCMQML